MQKYKDRKVKKCSYHLSLKITNQNNKMLPHTVRLAKLKIKKQQKVVALMWSKRNCGCE